MSFLGELRRRNVIRVGLAYVLGAWFIIQVVETIAPAFGMEAAVRWTVIVLGILLIPVLVLAWVFELTPEGLRKEKDVERGESITPRTGKRLDRIIMVVLALALTYFAIDKFILDPGRDTAHEQAVAQKARGEAIAETYGDKSIAVLPFLDLSAEGDQEYFSDGISEELLNLLAQIPELRVAGRTSAFSYKGKDYKIGQIGKELNVAHVLEGSVRKAGNQLRITAQLIETGSDTHLWSQTYDRALGDIFAIQDEIAAAVVAELKLKLLGRAPTAQKTDPAAYELALRADYLRRQNAANSLAEAEQLAKQALAIDPAFLKPMAILVTTYINQANLGLRPYDEGYELARSLALRQLEIHGDYRRVSRPLGWIAARYDGDLQAAARYYERGLAAAPRDAGLLGDVSTFLYLLGRLSDSIELADFGLKLDPLHPVAFSNNGSVLAAAGRYAEAANRYRTALSLSPEIYNGHYLLGMAMFGAGDFAAALSEVEKEPVEADRLSAMAIIYHALGDSERSDEALQKLLENPTDDSLMAIAEAYACRGETNAAFDWVDRSVAADHPDLAEIHVNPLFRKLHDDPRWSSLLQSLGRSPGQLGEIEFDWRFVLPD